MKIAIAGGIATGKTTIAKVISEKFNIPRISFGSVLRYYCRKQGLEPRRDILQNLGSSLILEKGYYNFLDWVINESQDLVDWNKDLIVEGFRHFEIYQLFYKRFAGTVLIYCDCSREEQLKRITSRDLISQDDAEKVLEHNIEKDIEILKLYRNFYYSETTRLEDLISFIISKQKSCLL